MHARSETCWPCEHDQRTFEFSSATYCTATLACFPAARHALARAHACVPGGAVGGKLAARLLQPPLLLAATAATLPPAGPRPARALARHACHWRTASSGRHAASMPLATPGRLAYAACALRQSPPLFNIFASPRDQRQANPRRGSVDHGLVPVSARARSSSHRPGRHGCAGCSWSWTLLAPVPSVFHLQAQARSCCRPCRGLSSVRGTHAQHTALRSTRQR
jgi:hypothetical protein